MTWDAVPETFDEIDDNAEYEPLHLNSGKILYKRSFSDVLYRLASDDEKIKGLERVGEAIMENKDVIPGVYEGGLKVWECSFDLASFLEDYLPSGNNLKVLEIGCGYGLPGIVALNKGHSVDFQDYNEGVLKLVTIPNVRSNTQSNSSRFYFGDWKNFPNTSHYDIIIGSEVLYNADHYDTLINMFYSLSNENSKIIIASKKYYFGLGGSLKLFQKKMTDSNNFELLDSKLFDSGIPREILVFKRK